ncbi:37S ribosomal protein, mitochondrial [Agyrium rufum]|nr:37S ribosomal protein, mitochondrial [Agyrium rufum]
MVTISRQSVTPLLTYITGRQCLRMLTSPGVRSFSTTQASQARSSLSNASSSPEVHHQGASRPTFALPEHFDEVVYAYRRRQHHRKATKHIGTQVTASYSPLALLHDPPSPHEITLPLLLASQTHLGHHTALWNPMNSRYIFGIRQGIHIISLEATASHLRRACRIVTGVVRRGGLVLFVGTRSGQEGPVVNAARFSIGCHLFTRWIPGSITNGQQILGHCPLSAVDSSDQPLTHMTHIAQSLKEKTRPALKPDLVVCLNPLENRVLLRECGQNGIPTIGIIDTDADPTLVTYPIPANDDSLRSIGLICGALGRAGEQGVRQRREGVVDGGQVPWQVEEFEESRQQRD